MAERSTVGDRATLFEWRSVDAAAVHENRAWFLGLGLALMVLGVLAIFLPLVASLVSAIVIGCLLLIGGLLQGVHALRNRRWAGSAWAIVGSLIQVIAGALIVAFPVTGTVTLTLILAAFFIADGILRIIRAFQHRGMPAWGFLLFDGLISLVLGGLIWWGWPSTAAWAIGLLVGINLLIGGSSMVLIGLGSRPALTASPRM